jgi:hypothetical protein
VVLLAAACGSGDDSRASTEGTVTPAPSTSAVVPTTVLEPTTATVAATTTGVPRPAMHVFPLSPSSVADYADAHHDYPAVDIFCPIGTEVVAVTDGVVDFVSRADTWDPASDDPALRGGISVAIVGDDGVRYYGSHLSSIDPGIEPGVRVRAGQRLGLSGKSGNARDTDPHLHFGISHPTTADDWSVRRGEVDPFPYLEAWRRGGDATPQLPG